MLILLENIKKCEPVTFIIKQFLLLKRRCLKLAEDLRMMTANEQIFIYTHSFDILIPGALGMRIKSLSILLNAV